MDAAWWLLWAMALLLLALAALGRRAVVHLCRPHPPSPASPWSREVRRAVVIVLLWGQGGLQLLFFFLLTGYSCELLDVLLYRFFKLLAPLLMVRASVLYLQSQEDPRGQTSGREEEEEEARQRACFEAPARNESLRKKVGRWVSKSVSIFVSFLGFYLWTVAVGELVGSLFNSLVSPYLVLYREFNQEKPSGYDFGVVPHSERNTSSELLVGLSHKVSSAVQPVVIRGVITDGLHRDIRNAWGFLTFYSEAQYCVFYLPLLLYITLQVWRLRKSIIRIYGMQPNETRTVTEAKTVSITTANRVHTNTVDLQDTKNEPDLKLPAKTTLQNPDHITDQEAQTTLRPQQHSPTRNEPQSLAVETHRSREHEEEEDEENHCGVCMLVMPYVPLTTLVMLLQSAVLQPLWEGLTEDTQQQQQQQGVVEESHVPFLQSCALFLPAYCALCFTFHAAFRDRLCLGVWEGCLVVVVWLWVWCGVGVWCGV